MTENSDKMRWLFLSLPENKQQEWIDALQQAQTTVEKGEINNEEKNRRQMAKDKKH